MEDSDEMNLNEAIMHCKENVQKELMNGSFGCASEHEQLAVWLSELQKNKADVEELVRVLNAICVLFDNGERKITVEERANLMIAKALIEKYSKEWTE